MVPPARSRDARASPRPDDAPQLRPRGRRDLVRHGRAQAEHRLLPRRRAPHQRGRLATRLLIPVCSPRPLGEATRFSAWVRVALYSAHPIQRRIPVRVPVKNGEVEVIEQGSGDLVVCVSSLGRGIEDFDALAQDLEAAGYRVAGVNHRGVGDSSPAVDGLTLRDFADDVARAIEHVGGAPAHLIGHAFGNRIVRCLASDRPDLTRSVTLIAPGGQAPPAPDIPPTLMRIFELDRPAADRLTDVQRVFFAPGRDASIWLDGWFPATRKMQWDARDSVPYAEWGYAGSAPVLAIQGLDDPMATPENGYVLRDQLGADRVEVVDLPDASHALLPEQPEAITREVLAFLAKH
ncbi:MAG: alpha/beta hydrolase [Chloroflexi bacterium]|nr:alpha/beta hydrolase [Chloroflexota bacterium]